MLISLLMMRRLYNKQYFVPLIFCMCCVVYCVLGGRVVCVSYCMRVSRSRYDCRMWYLQFSSIGPWYYLLLLLIAEPAHARSCVRSDASCAQPCVRCCCHCEVPCITSHSLVSSCSLLLSTLAINFSITFMTNRPTQTPEAWSFLVGSNPSISFLYNNKWGYPNNESHYKFVKRNSFISVRYFCGCEDNQTDTTLIGDVSSQSWAVLKMWIGMLWGTPSLYLVSIHPILSAPSFNNSFLFSSFLFSSFFFFFSHVNYYFQSFVIWWYLIDEGGGEGPF